MGEGEPAGARGLELTSPGRGAIVVFSDPIFAPAQPGEDVPWTRVSVVDPTSAEEVLVEDLSDHEMHAVFPALESASLWSPDGRYLLVIRAANVTPDEDVGRHQLDFLDVVLGRWAVFRGGGRFARTETFLGWVPTKPHTMLLVGPRGTTIEALPEGEPPLWAPER
jgi:hypothetical protein